MLSTHEPAAFDWTSITGRIPANTEPRWYAAYSCCNHEKLVADQLSLRSIEHFLPLYETVRIWKDRRKRLECPLFPGYLFVHLPLQERRRVLEIRGVVRLVGFGDSPVALPDEEMTTLRQLVAHPLCTEPHPYLTVGRRVRILRGPLIGIEGLLIRKKGKLRLVISVGLILQSATIEVDASDVEALL